MKWTVLKFAETGEQTILQKIVINFLEEMYKICKYLYKIVQNCLICTRNGNSLEQLKMG